MVLDFKQNLLDILDNKVKAEPHVDDTKFYKFIENKYYKSTQKKLRLNNIDECQLSFVISNFLNLKDRKIPIRRYYVKCSQSLAAYDKPSLKRVIEEIKNSLKLGSDVNCHLSSSVEELGKMDYLFKYTGLYHLHLESSQNKHQKKNNYTKRSNALLLVKIKNDTAYLLKVVPHNKGTKKNDEFYKLQQYLQDMHQEFPELVDTLQGISGNQCSEKESGTIMKKHGNICIENKGEALIHNAVSASGNNLMNVQLSDMIVQISMDRQNYFQKISKPGYPMKHKLDHVKVLDFKISYYVINIDFQIQFENRSINTYIHVPI